MPAMLDTCCTRQVYCEQFTQALTINSCTGRQLTYSMEHCPTSEIGSHLVKKFCSVNVTYRFSTVPRAYHWTLSWAKWMQWTPTHTVSQRSSLILPFHLSLDLAGCFIWSGLPTKTFESFKKNTKAPWWWHVWCAETCWRIDVKNTCSAYKVGSTN